MELHQPLTPTLQQLRRSGVLATLEARHRQPIDGPWPDVALLERRRAEEIERRAPKQLALRVRRATLNATKPLEGFDGRVHPTINRRQVRHLASCDDIRPKRHVWRCGPTGVGTSHLAHARAHEACRKGLDVLFVNTPQMRQPLHGGRADGTWATRLALSRRPALLVLDDLGLKPLGDPAPSDLYEIINERDEVGRMLVTSHRAPTAWPDLCGHPLLASAGLERLAHQAEGVVITGRRSRAQGRQLTAKPVGELGKERR